MQKHPHSNDPGKTPPECEGQEMPYRSEIGKKFRTLFKQRDIRMLERGGMSLLLLLALFIAGTSQVWGRQSDGGGGGGSNSFSGVSSDIPVIFQPTPCPFKPGKGIVEGQQVNCGNVTVPQNREVHDGKTVQLAVAIFKAPPYMHSVDPSPVLNLEGGPGASSLDARGGAMTAQSVQARSHDLVLFDQRGTGYSTPSLQCTTQDSGANGSLLLANRLVPSKDLATYENLIHACYNRLLAQGIDLNGFNTLQNADDVADLIHALGYQQMTLYGSSYGTRLAQTVMRLHPDVVRAVVLDSVESLTYNRNEDPADTQRAFNVLFQNCAQDAACNAKYPDLKNVFYNLVDQLNASPVSFSTSTTKEQQHDTLDGTQLVSLLDLGLKGTSAIPYLPRIIYQLKEHNYTSISGFVDTSNEVSTLISWGMFYSTECSENFPFLTQQDVDDSVKGVAPQIAKATGNSEQAIFDICQFWKVKPVPVVQRQTISSSLPTLVLAGEYDPITPPANAQKVANALRHSYFFLFPGQGHGELVSSCAMTIANAFLEHPDQQPDSSCLALMKEPAFQ